MKDLIQGLKEGFIFALIVMAVSITMIHILPHI